LKVLVATSYIYNKDWPEFTKNRTGFGMMVNDIFECISQKVEAYLLTQVITNGHGNILKHSWMDILKNAKLKDWIRGLKFFWGYKQSFFNRIKYFYYALNAGTIRRAIVAIKPDIVHIHGIGLQIKPFIDVCEEEKIPYIVTLHGLIGLDESIHCALWNKDYERNFLIDAEKRSIPVTVISTGMKHRIEKSYILHESTNISVICNGTKLFYDEKLAVSDKLDLKKEYGLSNEKIAVVIGSICERKNQIQIVRAFATGLITMPCHVFLCGKDCTNGVVQRVINNSGLSNRIHILGFLPKEKVNQVLDQADLNIVASKDEGFGLSIIEAYVHGVPTVTFSDLDAVPDLFDEECMICVDSRDDYSLAQGIGKGLARKWNKIRIKEKANIYSIEKMAEKYNELFFCVRNRWLEKKFIS